MDGNNRSILPNERKGMQRQGKVEDVKNKIPARARKVLLHGMGYSLWASSSGRERLVIAARNSLQMKIVVGGVRLHMAGVGKSF